MADVQPLMELAAKLAHGVGTALTNGAPIRARNMLVASATLAAFSFYAGKNIGGLRGRWPSNVSAILGWEQRIQSFLNLGRTTHSVIYIRVGSASKDGRIHSNS